jgi:amidohydrolase
MHIMMAWPTTAAMMATTIFFSSYSRTTDALPFRRKSDDTNVKRNAAVELYLSTGDAASSQLLWQEIQQQAFALTDFLVDARRTLHQRPELMYQEEETSEIIQSILKDLDVSFTTGWAINKHPDVYPGPGGYGIVADIGTGEEPCVLLRADMDALPIHERTPIDFRSQRDNTMHACGHDGHTTMLLGAASILKSMEHSLNGTVRLLFQPAEEGGAGALRMIEEGVLELPPKPRHALGMHVWPTLPSGAVASRPGPLLAACEIFEIVIHGVGGHAAMPHLTVDPIVTAAAIIMNLQTVISRYTNPLEAGVVSITKIQAGEAFNIIPASAVLRGTIRALTTETLLSLRDRVQHMVESTATTYGCTNVTFEFSRDFYPPTVNDPALYESFSKAVGGLVSAEGFVRDTDPTMGAEDFSFFAESIPSTFFLLGQGSGHEPRTNYGLHHPEFALDESVMTRGVELHVNWAVRALRKLEQEDVATQ